MISNNIHAKFKEFSLPPSIKQDSSAIIPTIKGTLLLKYGIHAYYFLNFKTLKGFCITIRHKDIILPGFSRFVKANYKNYKVLPKVRSIFQRYHYDFNFLEQIMLMTVPHSVTHIRDSRFFINLWSYFGYLDIDCKNRSAKYSIIEEEKSDHILGSEQFYDSQADELYYMSYSLGDSLKRKISPEQKVFCKILKHENKTGKTNTIWSGEFVDYLHDILINKTRQYCVVCELGLFTDVEDNIIPSKVLILDLKSNKHWIISRFIVAAHAQFDPDEPDIIYFSNHNFNFGPGSIYKILGQASYNINFRGPAAVFKYRLTSNGPKELGVFTQADFFRLTNLHVFDHRGKKIMAAMGSPNFLFIVDAKAMKYIKKIEVNNPDKNIPCIIGTFSPSIDGEKIFVHTNRSFQVVEVAKGTSEVVMNHVKNHSCSNHMLTSTDTDW